MTYPLISEYISSILEAEDNFKELTNLRPVLDANDCPVMSSGNFAVVFKMKDIRSGKLFAVKCFTKEQEGREEAYQLICEELRYVSSPYLVHINYKEEELFVDSSTTTDTEFPVVLMDWVDAIPLDVYINRVREDQVKLCELAFHFSKMAYWLLTQPFAHGDLKNDNILVREDGSLILVDYDGMFVPAMKGQKSREIGSPNYRHPDRNEDTFDKNIDDFTLCMMTMMLRALTLDASLLDKYSMNDSLLFRESDFKDIGKSPLHADLCALLTDKVLQSTFSLFHFTLANGALNELLYKSVILPLDIKEMEHFVELGACGEEAFCKFNPDTGELRIYGKRTMFDFTFEEDIADTPWCDYRNQITKVHIETGIANIGEFAFQGCTGLAEIQIPCSVTRIKDWAFSGCTGLTEIHIPYSVTEIGEGAFSHCTGLTEIQIPNSVKNIGEYAFL